MKLFQKIFLWLLILLFILLSGISIYIRLYGRQIVTHTLKKVLKQDVVIKDIRYDFPLGLKAFSVSVADFFQCQKINVQVNVFSLLEKRELNFLYVACDKPILHIKKQMFLSDSPDHVEEKKSLGSVMNSLNLRLQKEFSIPIYVDTIMMREGRFFYENGIEEPWQIDRINIQLKNLSFPLRDSKVAYHFSGVFIKEGVFFPESKIESFGWINAVKKDMDAVVNLTDTTAKVKLSARAIAQANQMKVSGRVSVGRLLLGLKDQKQEDGTSSSLQDMILEAALDFGVEGEAGFSFFTAMDDFNIKKIDFEGNLKTP